MDLNMTGLAEDVQRIEKSREAGKKAGAIAARRILMAHLNGKNVELLEKLERTALRERDQLTKHRNDEDGGRALREYWLAYIGPVETALAAVRSAA